MENNYPFQKGDHVIICDVCGSKKYRSECQYTWDGFIACTTNNCWYPKDPLFMIPPVINDPFTLQDVRPAIPISQSPSQYTDIRNNWGTFVDMINLINIPPTWNRTLQTWGTINHSPIYI